MKPDKIYINGFSAFATEPVKDGVEYIRKDVLMEWLIEQRDCSVYTDQDAYEAFQETIDKINSL